MKGVGYYDDRAFYPSSSNLSALAPPFTVNKTIPSDVSAPYVDSAESTDANPSNHFPFQSRPYGYDFFSRPVRELDSTPSSKAYGYSGLQVLESSSSQLPHFNTLGLASKDEFAYDQCSIGIKSNIVEAQPYYPSYIPPSVHDANSSATHNQWSPSSGFATLDESNKSSGIGYSGERAGLWNQLAESSHGNSNQVEVGGCFFSKEANIFDPVVEESITNLGCQDAKASDSVEVLHGTNMMSWEKHDPPISTYHLDDKSCWWQPANPVPFNFSSTSVQGSPMVSQETHYEVPFKSVPDSADHHFSHTTLNDKHLRLVNKPSLVNAGSSAPATGISMNFSAGNGGAIGNLGSHNITNMSVPSSESTGCFDFGQLRMHLERSEPNPLNNIMVSDKNVSADVMDYVFKARHGFQNPQASLNNLSLGFSRNEGGTSIEKSPDSVDRCNPAVDSPCWKGAPASHFSSFEGSKTLHPEYVKSNEECFSSNFQGPLDFLIDANDAVRISHESSKNKLIENEIDYLERGLARSLRMFSVTNFASEENNVGCAVNAGCFESKANYDYGLHQYMDDISEMTENSMPSNKSTHDSESRFSNNEQQITEENKFMSQKQHTLFGGCTYAESHENELKCGSSRAAEPSLSSSSSAAAEPTVLKKTAVEVSTPKMNIQMLVETMHNLSELLLSHCLNDACELKEADHNVLKNVISNLNTCASKNAEQMSPAQQCIFTQPGPSKCARESHDHQQNARFERPHLTKVDPECSRVEPENLPVKDAKTHHFGSSKQGKFSDSCPTKVDADMMKEDNMIKALKRILSENFHDDDGAESQTLLYKNLWLEAEAAICSINYRARYNRMKIEMEKFYKQGDNDLDVEEQSKVVYPSLCTAPTSAENLPLNDLSGLKFSPDLNKPCSLTPEDNGRQNLDSFVQGSAVSGTDKESGDCQGSTKAILYAHNSLAEMSCGDTANPKELPSFEDSHTLDQVDKLAPGQTDSEDNVNLTRVPSGPGKNKDDDYMSSVMARFLILKSRDEESYGNSANPAELPSSEFSHAVEPADELASGQTCRESQVKITEVPIPDKNNTDDHVSSVMARFHILKSWVEDSSSMYSEGELLDGLEFAGNGVNCTIIRNNASECHSLDVNKNPAMMHLSSYSAVEQSSSKEFNLNLEDDQENQTQGTYRFGTQVPTYYADTLSSEWEHV